MAAMTPSSKTTISRISEVSRNKLVSRIAAKAIKSTVVPMLSALTIAVIATTYVSYQISIHQLKDRVQGIGQEHRASLEAYLWEFDLEAVSANLRGFIDHDGIQRAYVVDQSGQLISQGDSASGTSELIKAEYQLTHSDGNGGIETLGHLTIEANKNAVWALVLRNALALIAIFVLSTAFITWLIIRQFNRIAFNPLASLSERLRNPDHSHDLHIDLKRTAGSDKTDELDDLVESILAMRSNLLTAKESMEDGAQRLASAAHLAGLAFCTFDPTLTKLLACDENYAAIHRKTVDEMLDLDIIRDVAEKLMDKESLERAMESRTRVIGGSPEIATCRLNFDDGEFVYFKQYFVGKFDENDELIAIDVIAQDVTHEQINQEMLSQSQKNKAIGNLTGGVAHDFNNILAVISGNLEFSSSSTENPVVICHNNTALEAVSRGARLTQQLLSFARKQPMSPVVLDVGKLVRESTPLIRTSAGSTIDLEIISDAGLWTTMADQAQLEAVLLNLVVNARDAMPHGGTLSIECSNARLDSSYARSNLEVAAGNYVCLSVTDSGHGMSPDVVRQCIEPFFTTKAVGEGTGLGLSMAFGFAKQSKGHLKIYSEEGHGTTVRLYLPKAQQELARKVSIVPSDHRSRLAGLRVFIIEDNEQLRKVISSQVESLGCVVYSAFDEPSSLALAGSLDRVDVILSDIILPGDTDGRRLSEKLARQLPNVKTIFMSGFTENSIIHNGTIDEGVVFLQKPFRLNELAQALVDQMDTESATVEGDLETS